MDMILSSDTWVLDEPRRSMSRPLRGSSMLFSLMTMGYSGLSFYRINEVLSLIIGPSKESFDEIKPMEPLP